MRFSLATIQPLKPGRLSGVTMFGNRAAKSVVEVCVVPVGEIISGWEIGVVMTLSFLCRSALFDFRIAARVNQIGAKDRHGHFHAVCTFPIPTHFPDGFFVNLLLQFDESRDEGLRSWRAARDIDIHGQELVNARDDVVSFFEWSSTRRACAHRYYVFWFRHLVIEANDRGKH